MVFVRSDFEELYASCYLMNSDVVLKHRSRNIYPFPALLCVGLDRRCVGLIALALDPISNEIPHHSWIFFSFSFEHFRRKHIFLDPIIFSLQDQVSCGIKNAPGGLQLAGGMCTGLCVFRGIRTAGHSF